MNLRYLVTFILTLSSMHVLFAQYSLEVDAQLGFTSLVKTGRFNPLTVSIANGGRDMSGDLVVQVRRGTTFRTDQTIEYRRSLSLPAQSRKRILFSIPLTSSGVPVVVWFERDGEIIYKEEISVFGKVIHSPLLLALSRTASFNFLMAGQDIVVAYPHIEMLPDRWDAYDSVDYVALHNADLNMVTQDQAIALEKWIDLGGSLFISGGTHLTRQPKALDRLLPVRVMGLAKTKNLETLESYMNVEITINGQVPVTMSSPRRGTVMVSEDGVPLLVSEKRGKGWVLFFAGDIGAQPFSEPSVRRVIWNTFTQMHSERDAFEEPEGIFEDPVLPDVLDLQNENGYSLSVLLGFLLVYLIGVLYFSLRKTSGERDHLKRFAAIIVVSGVASVGGYMLFAGNILKREYAMIDRTVITPTLNGTYALARKDIVLVSIAEGNYTITTDLPDTIVMGNGQDFTRIREGATVAVEDIHVSTWNQQAYTFFTSIPFSLDGSLVRKGDSLNLEVANSSDSTILDMILIYRGKARMVGTLSPGDIHSSTFAIVSNPVGEIPADTTTFSRKLDPAKYLTLNAVLQDPAYREPMRNGAVILLGWLSDSLFHASANNHFSRRMNLNVVISVIEAQ